MADMCNDFLCCLVFLPGDVTFERQADNFIKSGILTTCAFFLPYGYKCTIIILEKIRKKIIITLPWSLLTIEK